jgi:hypothetical protein
MPLNRSLASSALTTDKSPVDPWLAVGQGHDRRHNVELELLVGVELELHGASVAVV